MICSACLRDGSARLAFKSAGGARYGYDILDAPLSFLLMTLSVSLFHFMAWTFK